MAYDDEDLFDEEFDFVDDDDDVDEEGSEVDEIDSEVEEEAPPKKRTASGKGSRSRKRGPKQPAPVASDEPPEEVAAEAAEPEVEPAPTGPPADHVVHVYEFGKYKRTIQREFTDEDSIRFAEEFNRTSRNYGRHAVPAERTEDPEPHL